MMNKIVNKPEQSRKEHCGMEQQGVKRVLVYGATGTRASPVACRLLEDGFGVRVLRRPEVADANLKVCGPERLSGEDIAERFGRALGRKIPFRSMPIRQFGTHMEAAFGPGAGDGAVAVYEAAAYQNPRMFSPALDLSVALERLPIRPTPLEEWVRQYGLIMVKRFSGRKGSEPDTT